MEKYFTPDIEDIRVGYEIESYELSIDEAGDPKLNYDRWVKKTLDSSYVQTILKYGLKFIRVPYLTKEQIEAEGWKLSYDFSTLGPAHSMDFEKGDVWKNTGRGAFLSWYPHSNIIKITTSDVGYNQDGPNHSIKFKGECKDINTFRHISRLIKI